MTDRRGTFITFEGIDGAGKTTQIQRLATWLEEQGLRVVCTREPGGTRIGDAVRSVLLNPRHTEMAARTEVLLYAASRAQLVDQVIRPALEEGAVVLCDRFVDASIAYQGAGLGIGEEAVRAVNAFALGNLMPDLTLWFDIDWVQARERLLAARGLGSLDRIEQRGADFFDRVASAFRALQIAEPGRIRRIDARLDVEAMQQEIKRVVWNHINNDLE
ncbi:thymidylate kinase [Alicyclobacillus hesperidum URH17-3-68]|uniref:Thymidylate kinase n=1 Tax=Alicyclobacillus hesperidum TaxID=89784 RepID=A0A1H2TRK6_9BACL|nr:dTMP kinase [Alicyclobacillus hesperidum]EJY56963.1 thymidylate kinase [Alicyclobacillus hesperidum URH17-3-68]GLV13947.1 thymidylate kinase [Alicyclobacillus hesperidum]SDW45919.1 dTMP kinase [Alicyclobacillus hesperidum]